MIRISIALFLMALTTLMLELTLMRVFDVLWYANMAYMVVTLAMFCFGMSGVYSAIRPLSRETSERSYLAVLSVFFGLAVLVILPVMNGLPFNFRLLYQEPVKGMVYFLIMYVVLSLPFFLSGLIFSNIFSLYAKKIQRLYFWDLCGAAVGCVILIPFIPQIGPGGILFLAAGFAMLAAAFLVEDRRLIGVALTAGLVVMAIPFFHEGYFEFQYHMEKRGVKKAIETGMLEESRWDPVSKIDVVNQAQLHRKHIAYDGGTQSSFIYQFDGDLTRLREEMPDRAMRNFGGQHVYLSHYIKQDTEQEVLVIGSAAGQEIKAALMYGARHVDAVELVGFVTNLGKTTYADFNGQIFNHPNVNAMVGEGRSFLRASEKKYDIIQMFSNHTSSSIGAGTGAMATTYLQTAEAYNEYFSHLKDDGILHINHHIYPKMITTAALAWKKAGRENFRDHVLVFQAKGRVTDTLPTLLIKMTPWTPEEVEPLRTFFKGHTVIVEDPIDPEKSYLSDEFYSGTMSASSLAQIEYRVQASTDNHPYFNFLRKSLKKFSAEPGNFMTYSTAAILNTQLKRAFFPRDVIHLFITGVASLFFALVFIFVPLYFSGAGRSKWIGKTSGLVYFSALGAGFIIFELVFIQIFMKLIGYPLYTYSTVVFALLLAAGIGSMLSSRMGITPERRWQIPFIGIFCTSVIIMLVHQQVFDIFLQLHQLVRIGVASLMIFPLGIFLGMPFPLGILTLENKPKGAIAWAWAMNGLFTVIGGLASVVVSIFYGFQITIALAMCIYCIAFVMFRKIRLAR